MNGLNTVTKQDISETKLGRSTYVSIDGFLRYCITAPLLELPIDFKEWYKPSHNNSAQLYQI